MEGILLTKKEIANQISTELELSHAVTMKIIQRTFHHIIESIVEEGRIELRNFGVFEAKKRKARVARNPKTNEKVMVSEKHVVRFTAGKEMLERVRE